MNSLTVTNRDDSRKINLTSKLTASNLTRHAVAITRTQSLKDRPTVAGGCIGLRATMFPERTSPSSRVRVARSKPQGELKSSVGLFGMGVNGSRRATWAIDVDYQPRSSPQPWSDQVSRYRCG